VFLRCVFTTFICVYFVNVVSVVFSQLAEQQRLIAEQIEEDIDRLSRETISTVRFTMHVRAIMRLVTIL
jgi:hypothetical protein